LGITLLNIRPDTEVTEGKKHKSGSDAEQQYFSFLLREYVCMAVGRL